MIPPVIHQTWEVHDLPEDLAAYRASFRRHNPGLTLKLYDAAERSAFVRDRFPQLAAVFEACRFPVQKADLFRVLVVLAEGGFYADLDMECLAPLDPIFRVDHAVLAIESKLTRTRQRELGYARRWQIANCMFGAPAGHPFLAGFAEAMAGHLKARPSLRREDIEDATGPKALTRFFYDTRPRDVRVLAQVHLVPPGLYSVPPLSRRVLCRHHFHGSWKEGDPPLPFRRRLIERNPLPNPFPPGLWHDFGW